MLLTLLLLAQSVPPSRNEVILDFLTTPNDERAKTLCGLLAYEKGRDFAICTVSEKKQRAFLNGTYWQMVSPSDSKWQYPSEIEKTKFRTELTGKLKQCYKECRTWAVKRGRPEDAVWRETIFAEELIDSAGVMGNTSSITVDYQSGFILGADRRNYYIPYREQKASSDAEIERQIIQREGAFESKSVKQRWWPLVEVNPELAKNGRENHLVLLDMVRVKRGGIELTYFFDQSGRPQLRPERYAPHPPKELPPTTQTNPSLW